MTDELPAHCEGRPDHNRVLGAMLMPCCIKLLISLINDSKNYLTTTKPKKPSQTIRNLCVGDLLFNLHNKVIFLQCTLTAVWLPSLIYVSTMFITQSLVAGCDPNVNFDEDTGNIACQMCNVSLDPVTHLTGFDI